MTSLDAQAQETQAQQQQVGSAPPIGAPTPAPPPAPAQETPAQGLPPTGIDQQLATVNKTYAAVEATPEGWISKLVKGVAPQDLPQSGGVAQDFQVGDETQQIGGTSLQQLAKGLAQHYGLAIGRGNIIDAQGNFLMTPDQLASASGATIGAAAAKMNYISQAIARQQTEEQQKKGIAAIQTGLGQVQERGRGSLASLQTGLYQDLADLYSNQEYQAADFSYFIQKEQMDVAQELMRRQEALARKRAKKKSRGGFLGGIATGILGIATGNIGLGISGFSTAVGSAGETGWF